MRWLIAIVVTVSATATAQVTPVASSLYGRVELVLPTPSGGCSETAAEPLMESIDERAGEPATVGIAASVESDGLRSRTLIDAVATWDSSESGVLETSMSLSSDGTACGRGVTEIEWNYSCAASTPAKLRVDFSLVGSLGGFWFIQVNDRVEIAAGGGCVELPLSTDGSNDISIRQTLGGNFSEFSLAGTHTHEGAFYWSILPTERECLGDWNGDGDAEVGDLLAYLSLWFIADPAANVDCRGGDVTVADLLTFLSCWFAARDRGGC